MGGRLCGRFNERFGGLIWWSNLYDRFDGNVHVVRSTGIIISASIDELAVCSFPVVIRLDKT